MEQKEFWEKCTQFFKNNELELSQEDNFQLPKINHVEYYRKSVVTAGVFAGDDHYFLIDVSSENKLTKEDVEFIHESFRNNINSKIKTPRFLRLRVPNIVTVFISDAMPEEPIINYIHKIRRPWQGGEVHNVAWVSTNEMSIISHGKTFYNINGYFTLTLGNVDPSNRSLGQLKKMMQYVLGLNEKLSVHNYTTR
jgi:hypothetical protein